MCWCVTGSVLGAPALKLSPGDPNKHSKNAEEFVELIKLYVADAALQSSVAAFSHPPGRNPATKILQLSDWFRGMNESDKEKVLRFMEYAIETCTFGFLCVLDGARTIAEGSKEGHFRLTYKSADSEDVLVDGMGGDLHDFYSAMIHESTSEQDR